MGSRGTDGGRIESGPGPGASYVDLQVAWKQAIRKVHPDVAGELAEAVREAQRINAARDVLMDVVLGSASGGRAQSTTQPGAEPATVTVDCTAGFGCASN